MRLSFHNHTNYSNDCRITLAQLEARCVEQKIDAITITDHHTAQGAFRAAQELTKVRVIVGQEIETEEGEIIGLFLKEEVARGLPLSETIQTIHKQGGIVVVPHPFDRLRRHVLSQEALKAHSKEIDVIETFNARTVFSADNQLAAEFAKEQGKLSIVGNDAHTVGELGSTIVNMKEFTDAETFLTSLAQATFVTKRSSLWVHVVTKVVKWQYKLQH